MIRQRALLGALLVGVLLAGGSAACGDGTEVDAEEATVLAERAAGPFAYTTTYAADLVAPLGGIVGTIEGVQQDRAQASFHASVGVADAGSVPLAAAPRSFSLDDGDGILGRLAAVPTDVFAYVGTGDGLEAAGTARGFGDEDLPRFREVLDPEPLQPGLARFLTAAVDWLLGPLPAESILELGASVVVTGATLDLLVLRDGSAVDSVVLRLEYDIDADRFGTAVGAHLPTAVASQAGATGSVAAAASFRVAITG